MRYICIVDDNERKSKDILENIKDLNSGAETYCFTCANDFLGFLEDRRVKPEITNHPDEWLFLVDMQMPLKNHQSIDAGCGYYVLSMLKSMQLHVPAILISSEDVDDALAQENYGFYKGSVKYKIWSPYSVHEDVSKILQSDLSDKSDS